MENIHIILIGLIIIILLIALIVFLKMKNNNERTNTSKDISNNVIILPKDISNNLLGKTIYVNIDEYNLKYNFNYHKSPFYRDIGKVFKNIDLNTMSSATATVITDPETKEIYVNDKKVILYIAYIKYNILNYSKLINKPIYMKSDYMEKNKRISGFTSVHVDKELDTPPDTPLEITLEIVVTKPIKKNDTFTVYYRYGYTDEDRFIPPFLPEEYVTYF